MGIRKVCSLLTIFLLSSSIIFAQKDSNFVATPYEVHFKYELPITAVTFGISQYLYAKLPAAAVLSPTEALALDRSKVNSFDRPVLNFPASGYNNAHNNSNYVMYSTFALPALLLFDKNIRRDWKEFSTMYLQVHTLSSAFYLASSFPVRRARPLAYNPNYSIELRSGESTYNAFFSGHVNSTAATTFFMATIYDEYHDLSLGQKALLYTAACIPPTIVAQYRMRAGKHFRTDVLTGFGVGAATGILIPTLHSKRKNKSLSYMPYYSNRQAGFVLNYKF